MAEKNTAERISFQDFVNATLDSVLRAIEAHKQVDVPLIRNPTITVGIVWEPQPPSPGQPEVRGVSTRTGR